jgi:hypothetical protein
VEHTLAESIDDYIPLGVTTKIQARPVFNKSRKRIEMLLVPRDLQEIAHSQ